MNELIFTKPAKIGILKKLILFLGLYKYSILNTKSEDWNQESMYKRVHFMFIFLELSRFHYYFQIHLFP